MPKREMLVPITEARSKLYELARETERRPVVLLKHGRPVAVMVSAIKWEKILDRLEELDDLIWIAEHGRTPRESLISLEDVERRLDEEEQLSREAVQRRTRTKGPRRDAKSTSSAKSRDTAREGTD